LTNTFKDYAQYYDYFNLEKNYKSESLYIEKLIKKYSDNTKKILDIGCGTGLHDIELSKLGYDVVGIDISEDMINIAISNAAKAGCKVEFLKDVNKQFSLDEKFDTVISLFHVMSYQTTIEQINKIFSLVEKSLKTGGIFIFDFWYAPAVDFLKIESRSKAAIINGEKVVKVVEPKKIKNNVYNIQIKLETTNKTFTENHLMKSFFLEDFHDYKGFSFVSSFSWLTFKQPSKTNWTAVVVLRKTD
jgi:2-polyprenyl-3-methyl-5-hydroxy-6-metoxy-1,4-benzoquinol methylase